MRKRERSENEEKDKVKKQKSLPLDVLDVVDLGGARVGRVDADDLFVSFRMDGLFLRRDSS